MAIFGWKPGNPLPIPPAQARAQLPRLGSAWRMRGQAQFHAVPGEREQYQLQLYGFFGEPLLRSIQPQHLRFRSWGLLSTQSELFLRHRFSGSEQNPARHPALPGLGKPGISAGFHVLAEHAPSRDSSGMDKSLTAFEGCCFRSIGLQLESQLDVASWCQEITVVSLDFLMIARIKSLTAPPEYWHQRSLLLDAR